MTIVACGSDVMLEDDEGNLDKVNTGSESGGSESGGSQSGGGKKDECISCDDGDCALCALEPGIELYKCPGDTPPDNGEVCHQTGSVYSNGDGSSYVCWRCDQS